MRAPTVLAVSPHLDDAAFSAGGTLWRLARSGAEVVVATAFTATVPHPTGFALACQLDKGLGADVDYMALRRGEDRTAQDALGATPLHLPLPEAPHRGYHSAPALFGAALADDGAADAVVEALDSAVGDREFSLVLGPQGLGRHVDHVLVRDAVERWAAGRDIPVVLWRDSPYVIRVPEPSVGPEAAVALDEVALQAKTRACTAYASQLGFQFGGVGAVSTALRGLAATDAQRVGLAGAAEAFVGELGATLLLHALCGAQRLRP